MVDGKSKNIWCIIRTTLELFTFFFKMDSLKNTHCTQIRACPPQKKRVGKETTKPSFIPSFFRTTDLGAGKEEVSDGRSKFELLSVCVSGARGTRKTRKVVV